MAVEVYLVEIAFFTEIQESLAYLRVSIRTVTPFEGVGAC